MGDGPSEKKRIALANRLKKLGVHKDDLEVKFIRSSGHGGQNVNKVATCVQLKHLPTGIIVKCGEDRTQSLNRFLAERRLADKIEEKRTGKSVNQDKIDKIRRNKKRRARRARRKKN